MRRLSSIGHEVLQQRLARGLVVLVAHQRLDGGEANALVHVGEVGHEQRRHAVVLDGRRGGSAAGSSSWGRARSPARGARGPPQDLQLCLAWSATWSSRRSGQEIDSADSRYFLIGGRIAGPSRRGPRRPSPSPARPRWSCRTSCRSGATGRRAPRASRRRAAPASLHAVGRLRVLVHGALDVAFARALRPAILAEEIEDTHGSVRAQSRRGGAPAPREKTPDARRLSAQDSVVWIRRTSVSKRTGLRRHSKSTSDAAAAVTPMTGIPARSGLSLSAA